MNDVSISRGKQQFAKLHLAISRARLRMRARARGLRAAIYEKQRAVPCSR